MSEVVQRNFRALAEGLQGVREGQDSLRQQNAKLESQLAAHAQRVNMLEQQITLLLANRGSGPTQ